MWSITLKLMRKTKRMLIPAGIAIMIGTAFIASTFLFGNAMNDSLTRQMTAMFGNANYAVTVNSSDLSDEELNEAYSSTVGDFHLDQIKDLLFPAMEKKEKESVKRLDHQTIQKISGNKVKQELKIKDGIESDLAKKIVKLIKDGKLKVQASIQGDEVRVQGAKRDDLQACIALVTKSITDFPIKYGNFRD